METKRTKFLNSMSIKRAGICALLALAAAGMAACGTDKVEAGVLSETPAGEEEKADLSIFYSGENTVWISAMEELCEAFSNRYPQYTLQVEYSTGESYTEELKAKEATDEFPDVFEIEDPYMFEAAGKLGEIDPSIAELTEQPITVNGKICALPFYGTSYGIIYNKVIFKQYNLSVPETYDDFIALCDELLSLGITPLALGGSEESASEGWINYFFLTDVEKNNPEWIDRRLNSEVSFRDADMLGALEHFQDLMTGKYILEDSVNMGDTQIISYMINQEVAMYYGTPAMLAKIWESYPRAMDSDKTPLGEELEDDTVRIRPGWFYLPDSDGNSVVIENTGSIWAVSDECMADSSKKKAAEAFLKFCYEKDNYRKVLQAMYGMPVTKSAVLYAAPAVQQGVLTDYRYADRSEEFLGNLETPENFRIEMTDIINSLASNTIEVNTAARLLDESWNKATEEQKE